MLTIISNVSLGFLWKWYVAFSRYFDQKYCSMLSAMLDAQGYANKAYRKQRVAFIQGWHLGRNPWSTLRRLRPRCHPCMIATLCLRYAWFAYPWTSNIADIMHWFVSQVSYALFTMKFFEQKVRISFTLFLNVLRVRNCWLVFLSSRCYGNNHVSRCPPSNV